ncbi:glycosyltransferase [Rhizobium oryziradicis]|uniref:Glycosyl transferase family 1 n=1 Tax=Rhizobium oryziradicis TaxID=1867956 RepID=A0A1Q8ZS55_9HYPH|nr:glycosyltransferase [Rhizobium oryziradicis]OLP44891.1 glycosyl transferase family 1 [Rhizobium oryziradicis]
MADEIEFTGERYMPSIDGNIYLEHMHRYYLAKGFVQGKEVLDIASGEGFGSAILAQAAKSVIGVDISEDAVGHAQAKYGSARLSFRPGSCEAIPLPDASVDVVVSFETIEHIEAHEVFLKEIKRVLRPNGSLIISTPEKEAYTIATGLVNPFHVKELFRREFDTLLSRHFNYVSMHGQVIGFGSLIAPEGQPSVFVETNAVTGTSTSGIKTPMYMIAVASDDAAGCKAIGGFFSQDIQSSEPVLKRVEFEKEEWFDSVIDDIDQISQEVKTLQNVNWVSRVSLLKLLRRLVYSRLLYKLSKSKRFSERRRKRFLNSAKKRDPMLLSGRVSEFCENYYTRISKNKELSANRSIRNAKGGLRVTAIVPNYNHEAYLRQRLDSIIAQTYPLIDIVILDDCSSDGSRAVIESYVKKYPERIQAVYNAENSGGVFRQWKKGHAKATGDLVWICESDDFCEPDFVERMIGTFNDSSVMMAFGRIEFVDASGSYMDGMGHYREDSEPGIWNSRIVRPASTWFSGGFGVKNVIANVGGSIWRRFDIDDSIWETAGSYKIMGDWFLYSVIAGGGQIAYEPAALSYFRIHGSNTSGASAQSKPEYYQEYARLMASLKARWDIPAETVSKFLSVCRNVYENAGGVSGATFDVLLPANELTALPQTNLHVLIGFLGFSFGGGEIFPINLANALRRQGVMVSMLQMHTEDDHSDVRRMLHPSIPVYTANTVRGIGIKKFIESAGVSIIHSHIASIDAFLLEEGEISSPYIATLHGSYEAMEINKRRIARWSANIDEFAYTAERNLTPFEGLGLPETKFKKVRNAMPLDLVEYPKSRKDLAIADDAVVFCLVARGIDGKGWQEAVAAYMQLRSRHPDVPMALLMVGEGPVADAAKVMAAGDATIHFLGYAKQIHGIYRMSDVALIPTRFPGESYPLCLIQALQVGVPCIATDVGEIRNMSEINGQQAGIILPNLSNNDQFVAEITGAMEKILSPDVRAEFAKNAALAGATYNIDDLAVHYIQHYRAVAAARS